MVWIGPLHLSWSFIMERYCQTLGHLVTSRVHPWKSLANNVIHRQQFKSVEYRFPNVALLAKLPPVVGRRLQRHAPDHAFVLNSPTSQHTVHGHLKTLFTGFFSTLVGRPLAVVREQLPDLVSSWAQLSFDDGRDLMNAAEVKVLGPVNRDATFIVVRCVPSSVSSPSVLTSSLLTV
jgi:hypothetical protein